jgi:hypothetical protein
LRAAERKTLRRIHGAGYSKDHWRNRLQTVYQDMDTVTLIHVTKLSWFGHINRMDGTKKFEKVFEQSA